MLRILSLFSLVFVLAACGSETDAPATDTDAPADTASVSAVPTADLPDDADGPLVVYAGRKESLVGPLVEQFTAQTGIEAEVRYADDAALLAQMQEEGDRSPADVFWANTAGALGAAVEADLLTVLPDSLRVIPGAFVPSSGQWMPVTVRFRVLAYAPDRVDETALPGTIAALTSTEALEGRIGWTPTYSSFQDFLTALRLQSGEEATREWISGMQAAGAKTYASNTAMLDALIAGEIDVAPTNHYYVLRKQAEGADIAYTFFAEGDTGNLALVTGAGVLDTSARQRAARQFLAFLLTSDAQTFSAETTREVPVIAGVPSPEGFVGFEAASAFAPPVDVEQLRELEGTLRILRDEGLL
ncbi:MAG: extracellular solute-binding protein [Bacteroidota bacterium]